MSIVTICPGCGRNFQVDSKLVSRRVICHSCETRFVVAEGEGLQETNGTQSSQARVSKNRTVSPSIAGENSATPNGNSSGLKTEYSRHAENTKVAIENLATFYFNETPAIARCLGDLLLSLFDGGDEPGELKLPPDIDHEQVHTQGREGWAVTLPPHCIVCGKKTKRVFHLEERVLSPGYSSLLVGLGMMGSLLIWWSQIGWMITLAITALWLVLAYFVSRHIPVELDFSRCKTHAESDVIPRLRFFEKNLIIEVGHRRIRREFFREDEMDFNPVNEALLRQTAAERRDALLVARKKGEPVVEPEHDLLVQEALRTGIFIEADEKKEQVPANRKTAVQVHSGHCPQCEHPVNTDLDQCPECDASFRSGHCSVCGKSSSVGSPCNCNAGLIVSIEGTKKRFCRGCGSNWDGTTQYPWPPTSTKVTYCPRCLIDHKVEFTRADGIKDPDQYRLKTFDLRINRAKTAARKEIKEEARQNRSRMFKGIMGAAVGGDAAWGYAAIGDPKKMPRKERLELATLLNTRRWFLLQTELTYASKWERRIIVLSGWTRTLLLWFAVISVATAVISIAVQCIYSSIQ
ncbi:zinc ribbon domain-containing protein [Rubinisphaera margarita]|uniref:zinc ribbon domain-containing protein n=1 Tax=Rubinisphaera margarita TaxID=2909586 RepID=UPI001EE8C6EB|nr:zinc ribbon domain-containing protein [Rubinisphaera margarita]MCG6154640.1 zinc ribbon domain-containing protein [Rubinisphaera margarita]